MHQTKNCIREKKKKKKKKKETKKQRIGVNREKNSNGLSVFDSTDFKTYERFGNKLVKPFQSQSSLKPYEIVQLWTFD